MKRVGLIFISILLANQFCISQIVKIKKQLNEAFFGLDIPSTKYDVRKMIHSSDNFSDLGEYTIENSDHIEAEFQANYKLSYLQNSIRRLAQFDFTKGTDVNFAFGLDITYPTNYVETCSNEFTEMINFFKPISYKSVLKPLTVDNIKQGDIYYAYSSLRSYQNNDAYLIIENKYWVVPENTTSPPPGKYYDMDFTFYNTSLY